MVLWYVLGAEYLVLGAGWAGDFWRVAGGSEREDGSLGEKESGAARGTPYQDEIGTVPRRSWCWPSSVF